ncbi:hypothetical protein INT44_000468 [Umbelopsis vinacea]|uniref:Uncharacterized protein n=1 Tax=Umbelopsis vinacea TaxID=44442 RepID=A0A8H7UE02_9FUNG|nr:hypothetical protein INT44_000468 [Umbelopsis vinacea]KAI9284674.1 hypothetical protein BC943DRAFT_325370 [Umbelopsis sp. AD052]
MVWQWYNRTLTRHPLVTQCVTTATLFATGDVIAQHAVEKRDTHDYARTLRLAGFGGIVAAPLLSNWYKFLDRHIQMSTPVKALFARVALDQLLFAPCFIAVFFSAQGALEGKNTTQIKEKLADGYPQALKNNYKLWPAVQFFNFYVTPLNHRLMVTNIVALGWNTYLSTANQQSSSHVNA